MNDVIDDMIERNMSLGGNVVFVSGDEPDRYNGPSLVTRC